MNQSATGHAVREKSTPPRDIAVARALLVLVASNHLVIPIVMLARRSALESDIAREHPLFTVDDVRDSASVAIDAGVAFHGLLFVLTVALVVLLPRMRSWLLRVTIVSQLAGIAFSTVSWSSSTMFHPVIPIVDIIQLVIICCCVRAWRTRRRTSSV